MIKKVVVIAMAAIVLLCTRSRAQNSNEADTTGIRFSQLTWSEIQAKAKAEHKYLFVDCYATWCGPCKWMDANVYSRKDVGDVFNRQFISVRLQMDKTSSDDAQTKLRYDRAASYAQYYHIDAYPTFLFFDPDGNPVHKVAGRMDAKAFILLASDAQNPGKQYYGILKNFQPGKLDTAALKGLARAFQSSDKALAGKLAADYLTRVPEAQLGLNDNLMLMFQFRENPGIQAIAVDYLHSLTKKTFASEGNLAFIGAMRDNPKIAELSINYIKRLSNQAISEEKNQGLMDLLKADQSVQRVVQNYINHLPENALYKNSTIDFLRYFTTGPQDRGFKFFFEHTVEVDTIMHNPDWAQANIVVVITQSNIQPLLAAAKKTGKTPDFDSVETAILKTYSSYYAERVVQDAKVTWYNYLVREKQETQYWPELVRADIDQKKRIWADPRLRNAQTEGDVNNMCYGVIFQHSDDTTAVNIALNWMKEITQNITHIDINSVEVFDTYACLLYKVGKVDEALQTEQKLLAFCIEERERGTYNRMKRYTLAIQRMWEGEKIWLEKEFQD